MSLQREVKREFLYFRLPKNHACFTWTFSAANAYKVSPAGVQHVREAYATVFTKSHDGDWVTCAYTYSFRSFRHEFLVLWKAELYWTSRPGDFRAISNERLKWEDHYEPLKLQNITVGDSYFSIKDHHYAKISPSRGINGGCNNLQQCP